MESTVSGRSAPRQFPPANAADAAGTTISQLPSSSSPSGHRGKRSHREFKSDLAADAPGALPPSTPVPPAVTASPGMFSTMISSVWGKVSWLADAVHTTISPWVSTVRAPSRETPESPSPIGPDDGPRKRMQIEDPRQDRTTQRPPADGVTPSGVHSSVQTVGEKLRVDVLDKDTSAAVTKRIPPTQQLPSPQASEDESPVPWSLPSAGSSVRSPSTFSRRPGTVLTLSGERERPFWPKRPPRRKDDEFLRNSLRRRDQRLVSSRPTFVGFRALPGAEPLPILSTTQWAFRRRNKKGRPSIESPNRINKPTPKYKDARLTGKKPVNSADSRSMYELEVLLQQISQQRGRFQSWEEILQQTKAREQEVQALIKQQEKEKKERALFGGRIPRLTVEQLQRWEQAWSKVWKFRRDVNHIFVQKYRLELRGSDLIRLGDQEWLNDDVIDFYLNLLSERANAKLPPKRPKVIVQNTQFYNTLSGKRDGSYKYNYQPVSRWTRRKHEYGADIGQLDYVIIPVNVHGNHWCLGAINFKLKRFEYYDSISTVDPGRGEFATIYANMRRWVIDESAKKIDVTGWENFTASNAPKQSNTSDCGVFAVQNADIITRGLTPAAKLLPAAQMPEIRKIMLLEILDTKLVPRFAVEPVA